MLKKVKVSLCPVEFFVTPWAGAPRLLCPWNSPGKNTGVGSHSLLQGIFPTQGWNLGLLHCRHSLRSEPGVKNLPVNAGDKKRQVPFLNQEDSLEKGMTTHSSILAQRIPWTEEPGGLESIGSQRVGHG